MASILFVCLGNICRSPMAEGILRARLARDGLLDGWTVDSAGTSAFHVGEPPDPRTVEVLRRHDALHPMRARQVTAADFGAFDWILAMDRSNLARLRELDPGTTRTRLALALEPTSGEDVPDPYYGGAGGFGHVYGLLDQALDAWLERWGGEAP